MTFYDKVGADQDQTGDAFRQRPYIRLASWLL